MLIEANLPKAFWAEAVVAGATYLVNRSPIRGHKQTPEEAWSGRKPDLAHIRVFGAKVMAHIPKQKRQKWDAKSKESVLVGFDEDTKAYRLYDPVSRKVFKCRDVVFISEPSHVPSPSPASDPLRKPTPVRTFVELDFEEPPGEVVVVQSPEPDERPDPEEVQSEDDKLDESEASNYFSQAPATPAKAIFRMRHPVT